MKPSIVRAMSMVLLAGGMSLSGAAFAQDDPMMTVYMGGASAESPEGETAEMSIAEASEACGVDERFLEVWAQNSAYCVSLDADIGAAAGADADAAPDAGAGAAADAAAEPAADDEPVEAEGGNEPGSESDAAAPDDSALDQPADDEGGAEGGNEPDAESDAPVVPTPQ